MPELPEVETVRRGLEAALRGRVITEVAVRRGDLRRPLPADFASRLRGRTVSGLTRRAKYLIATLDDGMGLLLHLGMSGRVTVLPSGADDAAAGAHARHEHVVFTIENGLRVGFSDPRRFGLMDLVPLDRLDRHPLLAHLGPEPLAPAFDGAALGARLEGRRTSIKAALMDQTVVAGLGNIYACESLFRAGISPFRSAATVQGGRAARLAAAIRAVLAAAIAAGGSSLRDHKMPTGELGYFQHSFRVYGREGRPCPRRGCAGTVRRTVQSGRSTFHCPTCQR